MRIAAVETPDFLTGLQVLDLSSPQRRPRRLRQLAREVLDLADVPRPPVAIPAGSALAQHWQHWRRYLRRCRRTIRRGALGVFAGLLMLMALLQIGWFAPGLGWIDLGLRSEDAFTVARTGDVLLVGGLTSTADCDQGAGFWRSPDLGQTWSAPHVPELQFQHPTNGCVLAAIYDFAVTPTAIFVATSDAGLLRSDDKGLSWRQVGAATLPASAGRPLGLQHVLASPVTADLVFAGREAGGLYRSRDGGDRFERLDRADACATPGAGERALPAPFAVGALLLTPTALYAGSYEAGIDQEGAGLYLSRDDGNCWRLLESANQTYGYAGIAAVPGRSDQIVVLITDATNNFLETSEMLWQMAVTADPENGGRRLYRLWSTPFVAASPLVLAGEPPWFVIANQWGRVTRGPLDREGGGVPLPKLWRCLFPCLMDFALAEDEQTPLLLAGNRLFRLGQAPWWRRLWP